MFWKIWLFELLQCVLLVNIGLKEYEGLLFLTSNLCFVYRVLYPWVKNSFNLKGEHSQVKCILVTLSFHGVAKSFIISTYRLLGYCHLEAKSIKMFLPAFFFFWTAYELGVTMRQSKSKKKINRNLMFKGQLFDKSYGMPVSKLFEGYVLLANEKFKVWKEKFWGWEKNQSKNHVAVLVWEEFSVFILEFLISSIKRICEIGLLFFVIKVIKPCLFCKCKRPIGATKIINSVMSKLHEITWILCRASAHSFLCQA